MYGLCTMCRQCLWRPGEGAGSPTTGVELSHRFWEQNLGPLQEQPGFETTAWGTLNLHASCQPWSASPLKKHVVEPGRASDGRLLSLDVWVSEHWVHDVDVRLFAIGGTSRWKSGDLCIVRRKQKGMGEANTFRGPTADTPGNGLREQGLLGLNSNGQFYRQTSEVKP